jgi:hypothetical protein
MERKYHTGELSQARSAHDCGPRFGATAFLCIVMFMLTAGEQASANSLQEIRNAPLVSTLITPFATTPSTQNNRQLYFVHLPDPQGIVI